MTRTLIAALTLLLCCALLNEAADQYDAFVQWEHAPRFILHPESHKHSTGRRP